MILELGLRIIHHQVKPGRSFVKFYIEFVYV